MRLVTVFLILIATFIVALLSPIASLMANNGGRSVEVALKAGQTIYVGQPAKYPRQLVDAFIDYFRSTDFVEKAYLAQVFVVEEKMPSHCLIGVRLAKNAGKTFGDIEPELAKIASGVLRKDEFIDLVDVADIDDTGIVEQMEIFYEKR